MHELTEKIWDEKDNRLKETMDKIIRQWLTEKTDTWLQRHVGDRAYYEQMKSHFGLTKTRCGCGECTFDVLWKWKEFSRRPDEFKFCPSCGEGLGAV